MGTVKNPEDGAIRKFQRDPDWRHDLPARHFDSQNSMELIGYIARRRESAVEYRAIHTNQFPFALDTQADVRMKVKLNLMNSKADLKQLLALKKIEVKV
ncbi:hypothetical protein AYO44_08490 [Planctomycetaceae bacterium SCGC AG-212-F19]|nr:hypothetical protein AYO44_08490 [Planctomycetaceae bacterium SCGC AG-212-F19]